MDLSGKLVLAPMVRCGTLPMRLLALRYGADVVYSPEFIAVKVQQLTRTVAADGTGLISYVDKTGLPVFKTIAAERPHLVFQLGAATPETAVAAARVVEADVAAFDLNCGCPKHFSVHGGMGAALLNDPERLVSILRALRRSVKRPITCKIRLLSTLDATVALVRQIAAAGVAAVAVHLRQRHERPKDPAHHDVVGALADALEPFGVPLIVNGDVLTGATVERLFAAGASSFMLARGAQANPSRFLELRAASVFGDSFREVPSLRLFRCEKLDDPARAFDECGDVMPCRGEPLGTLEVVKEYVKLALIFRMHPGNIKFTLCTMRDRRFGASVFERVARCKTRNELARALELDGFCRDVEAAFGSDAGAAGPVGDEGQRGDEGAARKRKLDNGVEQRSDEQLDEHCPYIPDPALKDLALEPALQDAAAAEALGTGPLR